VIDTPVLAAQFQANATLSFSGHASDPEDGALPASALNWTFSYYQGAVLRNQQVFAGVASGQYVLPDWEFPVHLVIELTATDSGGLPDSQSLQINPQTVQMTFDSNPDGAQLSLNGQSAVAPYNRTLVVGSVNQIGAPSPQTIGGQTYDFSSWSNGGAAVHSVAAPSTATTLTATYIAAPPPPPAGLVAAYSFNEGAGTTLGDSSGNGLNGSIAGATWSATGKFGGALNFDGVNDWVTVADNNLLDLSTGMTVMAWVNMDVTSGFRDVLIKEGNNVDVYNLYARNWRGRPESNVFVGGTNRTAEGSTLAANTWIHLTGTYDGAVLRYYANGTLAASTNAAGSIATSTGALRIGGNSLWGEFFDGRIDEVRIYNRALSQAEIQSDMNTPVGSPLLVSGMLATPADSTPLTVESVRPVLDEAVERWRALGATDEDLEFLRDLDVRIADLSGDQVGLASPGVLWLDVDAAGRGWFVDLTPEADEEFVPGENSPATGKVDLLTVIAHELGHLMGLEHSHADELMDATLPLGARRMDTAAATDGETVQTGLDEFFAAFGGVA
jgi:hypothetical protein